MEAALDEAGIEWFTSRDVGVLSKYYRGNSPSNPIYVIDHTLGRAVPVDEYTQIFERYAQPARLVRVYVRPDQTERARHVVDAFRDKVH